jgi:hypothetical protein
MKDVQIDVELHEPIGHLLDEITTTQAKNALSAEIVEKSRTVADQTAREVGGRVRTDRLPEWNTARKASLLLGGDYLLVASRWWVTVPDSFDPAVGR